jgi:phenylalanyl-tRNA synthetase beta chain
MLIPLEWLKEHVDVEGPPEELAERLTMAGLEVEEIRQGELGEVFDLKITPNRGDCLSVIGVAREVAALTGGPVRLPPGEEGAGGPSCPGMTVRVENPPLCPRYVARLIRNVVDGPSPEWMQRRLTLAGLRPISVVVDITNYVMLETGQPLHAFDYESLREGRIVVRTPRPGERLTLLDGTEVRLDAEMLLIADGQRPVALAGVMGGAETEVTPATRHVLLEAAHFDPASVRRTAKRLGISTAASYRFERFVDPNGVLAAADRAASLMARLAGGEVSESVVDAYPEPRERARVRFRPERARALLGAEVSDAEAERSLKRLAVQVARESPNCWVTRTPTWRPDLQIEEDLIEEVGRLHGYAELPSTLPGGIAAPGKRSDLDRMSRVAREHLLAQGCFETAMNTLTGREWLEACGFTQSPAWPAGPARLVTLRNPLSEEYDTLRPSLIPGLLAGLERNMRHGAEDVFLFDVGRAHAVPEDSGVPEERLLAAALLYGSRWAETWNADPKWAADFFTAKGIVETLARALDLPPVTAEPAAESGLHPGRSARFRIKGRLVGAAGEIHPEVAKRLDLPRGVYVLECDLEALGEIAPVGARYSPPSRFPPVLRDLAVVVPARVTAGDVEAVLRGELAEWLREARVFDVYRGRPLPEDRVSLAFHLRLGTSERTLTDEEVDARMARVQESLRERLGAEIRA